MKVILDEEHQWYYFTHSLGGFKQFHAFPKRFKPKGNIRVWLDFELAYNNVEVSHVRHVDPYHFNWYAFKRSRSVLLRIEISNISHRLKYDGASSHDTERRSSAELRL